MPIGLSDYLLALGNFHLIEDTALKGGYRIVADITERDAISVASRKEGMRVFVISSGETYQLDAGLANWNWVLDAGGGGGITGPGSSTDTAISTWSGTDGTALSDTNLTIYGQVISTPDADSGSSITIQAGTATLSANSGGDLYLLGGISGVTGTGGQVSISAGDGGSTSGDGGQAGFYAGAAQGGDGNGGSLEFGAGSGDGTGFGGEAKFESGPGGATGSGGDIVFNAGGAGGSSGGYGGWIRAQGGMGGETGSGGNVVFQGGLGGTTSGPGGDATVTGGDAQTDGSGGNLILAGGGAVGTGSGGYVSLDAGSAAGGGQPGYVSITTGEAYGGDVAGGYFSVVCGKGDGTEPGGPINLVCGPGGDGTGEGGSIRIQTGDAGATSGGSGSVNVYIGEPNGGAQGAINLLPSGSSTEAPELRFFEDEANGASYFGLKAAADMTGAAGSTTYILPDAYPASNGYALTSTTSGVMSWADVGGGGGGAGITSFDATLTTYDSDPLLLYEYTPLSDERLIALSFRVMASMQLSASLFAVEALCKITSGFVSELSTVFTNGPFQENYNWNVTVSPGTGTVQIIVEGNFDTVDWRVTGTITEHTIGAGGGA